MYQREMFMKYAVSLSIGLFVASLATPALAQIVTPPPQQKDTPTNNQSLNICAVTGVNGGVLAAADCLSNEQPSNPPISSRSIGIDITNPRITDDVIL